MNRSPLYSLVLLIACGAPAEVSELPEPPPVAHAHGEPAAEAHHPALALQLNDGARWAMDEHTRMVFGDIRDTLKSAELTSTSEIAPLGEKLSGLEQDLISGCTMEGAAHDQLHVFLIAWMPAVEAVGKQTDLAEGQKAVAHLRGLVAEYDKHFE